MQAALDSLITEAERFLGSRITTNGSIRETHSHGEGSSPPGMPDGVAFPETTEEVSRLVALCHARRIPVIAFGAGTSLEGHVNAVSGGLTIDLSRMNRILAVNPEDMDCRIEAGVTRPQLNDHLRDQGLFMPIDPGAADCTLGGMCATRASGTNAVRYGTIRENVLGLTVVMADGRIVQTGGRVRKSATGYDLTRLFIGSEGTLGIITEIQMRLHGIPEAISAATCQFDDMTAAVQTVIEVMQAGVPVARIELLDEVQAEASIAYSKLEGLRPVPTLFFEFHGTPAGVQEQATLTETIAKENGAVDFAWAVHPEDRARLWKARHDAYWACRAMRPGFGALITDSIVPISRLPEAILGAKADIAASGLLAPMVGHVGDGNFHTVILVPPEPDGFERAWALDKQLVARALDLGGSCSGEHGVGAGKRGFLLREHGAEALDVMQTIKAALDPLGILNPGKLLPAVGN
ncbi:FAD-binding oxidoreductase [Acidisoma cladoniae]|jgi:D-lactate dehydrogenase (cytochrome)|uniref:FAD-binding oxidoreductase n=1 Tax=Acidisoma cladoniae TaxID=3040935 RepID=UPI002550CB14|nr:FAD-linked oxidase C-terminal domain-containing protein [Acidisoma sp. PAMC 29798]